MPRKCLILIVSLLFCAFLLARLSGFVQASTTNTYTVPVLSSSWITGILSDEVGTAGILVEKLTPGGEPLTVTCSRGHLYALTHRGSEVYEPVFYSQYLGCSRIASGDRNGDGVRELYVATNDQRLLVLDGDDFQQLRAFSLPVGEPIEDLAVGDVDGDGVVEVIVVTLNTTLVYHATTFALEWDALSYGGYQVRIGNIDTDPLPEMVVNNNTAYVLNASQQSVEWSYSGGFGERMDLGDVDNDGRAEIAYVTAWDNAYVIDGDTQTYKWQLTALGDLEGVRVADANGDGVAEVIIGNGQWGYLRGYRGAEGDQLWEISNPEHGVSGIGVGDTNNDGINEVVWGAGLTSSGRDALFIGDWQGGGSVLWASDDLDGPLYVAAGDLDQDGSVEMVMASYSSVSEYGGGMLGVYDGATRNLEWTTTLGTGYFHISHLAIGQVDSDPALEIVVAGDSWYITTIHTYDGLTHALEWESPGLGSGLPYALAVGNIDGDPVDEIAIGLSTDYHSHVQVLNGASPVIQWDSASLDGDIIDLSLGNLADASKVNLAVLTTQSVYIYEPDPWVLMYQQPVVNGQALAIANADLSGQGELLLVANNADGVPSLFAYSGAPFIQIKQHALGDVQVNQVLPSDLDGDLNQEFILFGRQGTLPSSPSLLWVGAQDYPTFWEYRLPNRAWGNFNGGAVADVDGDNRAELLVGSEMLIQLYEVTPTVRDIQLAYLPIVHKPRPMRGLYGTVSELGNPVAGIPLQVRFFNGAEWSTVASGYTALDGSYSFTGLPGLAAGQYYYVLYQNSDNNSYRLWTWHTKGIESFQVGTEAHMGDFDVANIPLYGPFNGDWSELPETFEWRVRSASPEDSYEFNLYDPYDGDPYFYTDPPLGYIYQYTLTSLPAGFRYDTLYAWEIWTYSPDGGFGVSFESWAVYFYSYSRAENMRLQPLPRRSLEDPEALLGRKP